MNKLEETNLLIDSMVKLNELGITVNNAVILADIAKSLAMIANKLCECEEVKPNLVKENKDNENES